MVYEMRTYYAAPGRLSDLNARFRNYTCRLFEKHGMANVGYWVPLENPEHKLIYILAHASPEAAASSWKSFGADPEWHKVVQITEAAGKLVARVDSTYLAPTDFSALK